MGEYILFLVMVGLLAFFAFLNILVCIQNRRKTKLRDRVGKIAAEMLSEENQVVWRARVKYIKRRRYRKILLMQILILFHEEDLVENPALLDECLKQTGILKLINRYRFSKDNYHRAFAYRFIAKLNLKMIPDFKETQKVPFNFELVYHLLLSVAHSGQTELFLNLAEIYFERLRVSYRAFVEIISEFSGPKDLLLQRSMETGSDYIKTLFIKAIRLESCRTYYYQNLNSENLNLKIACIRAICDLADKKDEVLILKMLKDNSWQVRATAAKGLKNLMTPVSLDLLNNSSQDNNVWVLQNANSTLAAVMACNSPIHV